MKTSALMLPIQNSKLDYYEFLLQHLNTDYSKVEFSFAIHYFPQ